MGHEGKTKQVTSALRWKVWLLWGVLSVRINSSSHLRLVVWPGVVWTGIWVAAGQLSCQPADQTELDRLTSDLTAAVRRRWLPFMEALRGDEPGTGVVAPEATSLPPGVILSAHYLEDVAPGKGHSCLLARDGRILTGVVVKQGLNKQLRTMETISQQTLFSCL